MLCKESRYIAHLRLNIILMCWQLKTCASGKLQAHPPIPQVFLTLTALQTYSNSGGGGGGYGGYSQYGGYSPGYEQTHRGGFIVAGHSTLLLAELGFRDSFKTSRNSLGNYMSFLRLYCKTGIICNIVYLTYIYFVYVYQYDTISAISLSNKEFGN